MNSPLLSSHFAQPQKTDSAIPFRHASRLAAVLVFALLLAPGARLSAGEAPNPPASAGTAAALMLAGDWVPGDPSRIDFAALPRVPSEHVVVSDVRASDGVNQHAYLAFHLNQYWLMWSDGPGLEDRVGQRVKFSTSEDGLNWREAAYLTPEPPLSGPDSPHYNTRSLQGFRWIARGFWPRRGELLALAALDEAADFFGPSLQLRAFRLDPKTDEWHDAGVISEDTINNFPPLPLPSGGWIMSRRPHDYRKAGVHFLLGGESAVDHWESVPVPSSEELAPEEPFCWIVADGRLEALFRDNHNSGRLFRSFSTDQGRTWSPPVRTNFPDATSKFHGTRLEDGRYVLVSNANPAQRDPLTLSISPDGLVFNEMLWLAGGRQVDYPCVLEHQGNLLIAFSGEKRTVEVLRVRISDLPARQPAAPSEPKK